MSAQVVWVVAGLIGLVWVGGVAVAWLPATVES